MLICPFRLRQGWIKEQAARHACCILQHRRHPPHYAGAPLTSIADLAGLGFGLIACPRARLFQNALIRKIRILAKRRARAALAIITMADAVQDRIILDGNRSAATAAGCGAGHRFSFLRRCFSALPFFLPPFRGLREGGALLPAFLGSGFESISSRSPPVSGVASARRTLTVWPIS